MSAVYLDPDNLAVWQSKNLEYLRYDYPTNPGDKILDIGAYQHEWGKEFEKRGCVVEYFEALDNRAAWTHDGWIELGGAFYYSSAYAEGPKQKYGCEDIARYLHEEIALAKLNIEGHEYALLSYMMPFMANINYLQVQFHRIEGVDTDTAYSQIVRVLSMTHELEWRYPFVWESWKRK